MMKQLLILTILILFVFSINAQSEIIDSIVADQRATIVELSKTWGEAIRSKDISLLKDLYGENAHYLPDNSQALYGRDAIVEYWASSLNFMSDLTLNMESLEGTEELLYETGKGVAKIMNDVGVFKDFHFKYVNVWALQPDGNYQVVIDIFNGIGR